MDSIANHYAAKRVAPTPNSSSLVRSTSSRSLHQSQSDAPAPKRIKLPGSLKSSHIFPEKKSSHNKLPEKNLVAALRESGWAAPTQPQAVSLNASIRSRIPAPSVLMAGSSKGKEVMRPGLYPNDGRDAEREREERERKRKLELARARRKSQVGGPLGGRRRSTIIGRELVFVFALAVLPSTLTLTRS
jgi:hypothetical protein